MSKAILAAILISAIALGQSPSAQTQQPILPQPSQPERVLIDAYDAAHVNGLVFVTGLQNAPEQNFFGLRFLVAGPNGIEISPSKFELGTHAPDGKFARVSWRPEFDPKITVTLRWHRAGKAIVGQLSASGNVRLSMEAYRPWSDARNELSWALYSTQSDNRTILGEQIHNQKTKAPLNRFLLKMDRAMAVQNVQGESVGLQRPSPNATLVFDLGPNAPVGFIALVGEEFEAMESEAQKLAARPVVEVLDKAEKESAAIGTMTGGALGDSFEAILRATMWNRFYSPTHRDEYITMNRLSGKGLRGDVLGLDSLLLSMLTALTDGESSTASLRILLTGQTPDGRVPLRRYMQSEPAGESPVLAGRSLPPLGAFAVFKVYLATQDLAFLAWAYPRLQQWNRWWHANRSDGKKWRDGNMDGLLENGVDAELEFGALGARQLTNTDKLQMALAEAGLPANSEAKFNDEVHTLTMSPIALNSLYALDTELMALISKEIGMKTEADRWQERYDEIKRMMNEHMWSEDDRLYLDRHWNGKFSGRKGPDLLLPLLAGIPDQPRAKMMLEALRESKELAPTADSDQAAMNYLLYLGMKRYGFEVQAAELAKQSLKAADSAKPTLSNPLRPVFTPLIYLPAIEELMSADPWFGLTFGNLNATEEGRIERVQIAGSSFDVTVGPKGTVIRRNGKVEIEFEGPVKLRGYRSNDRALACLVETKAEVRAKVHGEEGKKITASVDEKVLGSTSIGATASFKIKEGSHKLLVVK